jgi:glutamyl-tRNA reductase
LSNHLEQPILFAVGINHKTASIEAREKIYVHEREIPALIAKLSASLAECVVLSTCNRTEIYGVTTRTDLDLDYYKDLLIDFKNAGEPSSASIFSPRFRARRASSFFRWRRALTQKSSATRRF